VAVKKLTTISRYTGTSFDTKPTSVPAGSTFREYDTRLLWETYDGTNWKIKSLSEGDWLFGEPTLMSQGISSASWIRGSSVIASHQKGHTGWVAKLDAGIQTAWNDAAEVYIPVNEMPLPSLQTGTTMWSYLMTATEMMGVSMVIWAHDPTDFDKRGEMSQVGGEVEYAAGWNAHELASTDDFVYYAENEGSPDTCTTEGTQYNLSQYQADSVFSTWTIYRISFAFGFETSDNDFDPAYLADVKINGQAIRLGPIDGKHRASVQVAKTMIAAAKAAGDVLSEDATTGTDWDFPMGGTGYITKAVVAHDAAITTQLRLFLFDYPPTGAVDDNVANSSPLTADVPYFVGSIDFPAMKYLGTGDATTVATPSTSGNLPLAFDKPMLYGILTTVDGVTTVAEALTITLTADMQD